MSDFVDFLSNLFNLYSLIVFLVTLSVAYYISNLPSMRNMPPGPLPLPVIGNLKLLNDAKGQVLPLFRKLRGKYGKIFTLRAGYLDIVVISDIQLLKDAFVKQPAVFTSRPGTYMPVVKHMSDAMGAGIIINNGKAWKDLRKLSLTTMRDFGVGKQSLEEKILAEGQMLLECVARHEDKPTMIHPFLIKVSSNIICSIIFGHRFDYDDPRYTKLLDVMDESMRKNVVFVPVNFFPILRYVPAFIREMDSFVETFKTTVKYVRSLIPDHETDFDPDNLRDFVDLYINTQKNDSTNMTYNEANMLHTIVDLFTAGSDTTAATFYWLLLFMASNPRCQVKCHEELDRVLAGRPVKLSDRPQLRYTDAIIMEVVRMRNAAPIGIPHCAVRDAEVGGYLIPARTMVVADINAVSHDSTLWPEPDTFKPERFLDANGEFIHKDIIVSFAVGPRSCPGEQLAKMELLLIFSSIMQRYKVSPPPGKTLDLTPEQGVTLHAINQELVFTRR